MLGLYAYEAADVRGKVVRGQVEATSPAALARSLEERGLFVLEVVEATGSPDEPHGWQRGRRSAVLEVTRAVAALLGAGMPLARALATAAGVARGDVAGALTAVRKQVEGGEALAVALARHPAIFPPVYVGLVRAGERSGDLPGAFEGLVQQLEREEEIRARLLSAMVYPMVLGAAGGAAIVVLLFFVLPRFVEVLGETGAALPASTRILLALAVGFQRGWPVLLGFGALLAVGLIGSRSSERGRRVGAELLLRMPGLRTLRREGLGARFARLVAVLLGGGAPLLTALDDAQQSMGDPVAQDEVARIRARVREGASLRAALAAGKMFPPLLGQLVAVGEEAGQLRTFLLKAAEILERKTERTVHRLVTLVEPAMIIAFGGIVAFVALSLLQAIYGVNTDLLR